MRIIIFGIGAYFFKMQEVFDKEDIVAFIDNDKNKWNRRINNIQIFSPSYINGFSYDKIVVMAKQKDGIIRQLINEFGIEESLIFDYESYCEYCAKNKALCELVVNYSRNPVCINKNKKKILIITYILNYTGSSLAAFYAASALIEKEYDVAIATSKADNGFVNEITKKGVTVYTQELIEFCTWEQISWIEQFDFVIINTLPILRIIKELISRIPIMWWIHESKIEYENLDKSIIEYIDNLEIETYVVSDVALHTFHQYFNILNANILHYGIPDKGYDDNQFTKREKLIFAVIGGITSVKAQDIMLQAIIHLTQEELNKSEFWLIGVCPTESQFGLSVLRQVEMIPEVKWMGELNREELEKVYKSIDVVVVPSRQETLSIVATEALMYGKILIVSNVVGIAKYIEHKKNGYIFENENVADLTEKISWVLNNKNNLKSISLRARQTYDEYFTLDIFEERLEEIIGKSDE